MLPIEWTNEEARRSCIRGLGSMIESHGGKSIIASRDYRVVDGAWRPGLFIVIKFSTRQALLDWYDSEEYRLTRKLRLQNSRSDAMVVEGN